MVGAILGGLSAVASGISAIQNFQQAKQADRAAQAFADNLKGMLEVDKMAALQAPDLAALSSQQTAQQTASATQAVQGMGAEGAAQIANIYQAGQQAEAQTAQQQAALNLDVEAMKAQAAQNVEFRNLERQREFEAMRLMGAQERAAEKRLAGQQAIGGLIGGIGMAAGDIAGLTNYGKSAQAKSRAAGQVGTPGIVGSITAPTYEQYLQAANQGMNLLGID